MLLFGLYYYGESYAYGALNPVFNRETITTGLADVNKLRATRCCAGLRLRINIIIHEHDAAGSAERGHRATSGNIIRYQTYHNVRCTHVVLVVYEKLMSLGTLSSLC